MWLDDVFGVKKPVIAMLHLMALPGDPGYDTAGGMKAKDVLGGIGSGKDVLAAAGFKGNTRELSDALFGAQLIIL